MTTKVDQKTDTFFKTGIRITPPVTIFLPPDTPPGGLRNRSSSR